MDKLCFREFFRIFRDHRPFGPTLYPALAVSSEANSLDTSTLSLWGYVGGITLPGKTAIPSIIVGTSNLTIVNVTVPDHSDA